MVGSAGSVYSGIVSAYNANANALSEALARIASGKKFRNASEDFIGFIRSRNLQADIGGYRRVREELTGFKAYTTAAVDTASAIYEDLAEMKSLVQQYAGTGDADLQAEYESEFNALKTQVSKALSSTNVDGHLVTSSGVDIASVSLDPDGAGSITMNFTDIASMEAGLTIDAEDADTQIQTEIDSMLTYLSEAKAYDGVADRQLQLTDTIINSKQAVLSLITDIDEAEEASAMLDLSVRQQAGIAMLAQGNILQNSLLKLYE